MTERQLSPVGRIVGAFGIRGQVKVELLTDFEERFAPGSRLKADGDWLTVAEVMPHMGRLVVQFEEITNPEDAKERQWQVLKGYSERPELEDDEYMTADLLDMEVFEGDEKLGNVDDVLAMPAHDVLVVGEIMIPAVKAFVKRVDLERKRIEVKLIEGMRE